jgi:copper chaperone CopZ
MRLTIAAILISLPLCAELKRVEMTVGGLDCDSCALSVDRVVKRIRGVDTAEFDDKKKLVTVTFKPENKVTIAAIRDAVKGVGYTPGETKITARGSLTQEGGEWHFLPSGWAGALKAEVPAEVRANAGIDVVIEGIVPEAAPDLVKVKSAKKAE